MLIGLSGHMFKRLTMFAQGIVDASNFVSGRDQCLLRTDASFEPTIEGTQCGIGLNDGPGGKSKRLGGAVVGLAGFRTEDSTTGDVVVRGEAEPGAEMFGGRPSGHVHADFSKNGLSNGV